MKKFLMTALATTAVTTAAHAGSISYDFRGDYQSADYNSTAESATKQDGTGTTTNADFARFYFKIGRIDFKGNLNEDTSYRLRWAFYGTAATGTRDNIQNTAQLAYLNQKLGSGFSVTVGRFATDIGAFEGMSSGAELYLVSESYSHAFGFDKLASYTYGTGDNNILYMTGVKADYTIADNTIEVMAMNPPQDETVNSQFQQNTFWYGAAWKGAFMDKALSTIVSYHMGNSVNRPPGTPGNYNSDDKTAMYSAGIKWDVTPFMASLEYIGQKSDYKNAGSSFSDKMDSFVVKAAYTGWDNFIPRLEYTASQEKVDRVSATNKFSDFGVVLEYKPRKDDIFRYHVAYQNVTEKPETGSDLNRQEIVVGARLLGDFLKN